MQRSTPPAWGLPAQVPNTKLLRLNSKLPPENHFCTPFLQAEGVQPLGPSTAALLGPGIRICEPAAAAAAAASGAGEGGGSGGGGGTTAAAADDDEEFARRLQAQMDAEAMYEDAAG